jgi:PAS domain S-box-containing protein
VSLLLENHLIKIKCDGGGAADRVKCWETLACAKVLCPAHGRPSLDCWLIPKTHCANKIEEDFFQKLSTCLACAYFKEHGQRHPQGWNHFLAEQVHKYNTKALELIYQKEESFVETLNRIPDGLFTIDNEWRITYFNPAAEKITGFSAADAVGMYCKDVFKNSVCETDCALKRAIAEGRNIQNREYMITSIEGKEIPVICSTSVFRDGSGRIAGGLEIFKDITEPKKNEEKIWQRNRELSILNSLAVALNDATDLGQLLKFTLEHVLSALRLTCGSIFLIDPAAREALLQAQSGLPVPLAGEKTRVIFKDKLLKKHLIDEDTYLAPQPTFPSFQVNYQLQSGKTAPWLNGFLITFKGRAVGFFGLDIPASRVLNRHEVHLIGSLGNFLGGAIENTKLLETIRQHRQELSQLTEKLFQSQEEERRRIARELHDEAGQSLTAIKLGLDRLEENHSPNDALLKKEIGEIRKMIKRTSSEIRRLSYHLHPTLLIDLGLEPALDLYFKEIESHSSLDIEFNMVGFDRRLAPDIETVLYRFSQEALTNTLKHSGAEAFVLSIIKSYPRIIFQAEDDGVGFDTQIVGKDKRSLGIIGMRERATLLGGTFQLRSFPGQGTRIRIKIPYPEDSTHE